MSDESFTIAICPRCGGRKVQDELQRRHGGTYCYCQTNKGDPTRCEEVEVIPASAPNVLTADEARLVGRMVLNVSASGFDDDEFGRSSRLRERLSGWAEEERCGE